VDGIEPLATKGLRLQRSDGTSPSLLALPVIGCRSASRTLPKTAYETARTTGSTCIEDHCDAGTSAVVAKLDIGLNSTRRLIVTQIGGEPRTRISHLAAPSVFEAVPARLSG